MRWIWRSLGLLLLFAFSTSQKVQRYVFPELKGFPPMPLPADNAVTVEGVALGRQLFYDPVLSKEGTLSCASCHRQEAAFSDAPFAFSKGRNGLKTRRNTPPLFNLAWYPSLFWDGRAASIEDQVFHPVRDTAELASVWTEVAVRVARKATYRRQAKAAFGAAPIDSVLIAKAIGQFLRTLLSYRSKYDRVLAGKDFFTPDEYQGFVLINDMSEGDCLHCHSTDGDALGALPGFSNNGLDRDIPPAGDGGRGEVTGVPADWGKFKIPTLRNVALTAPYMHDGRFATLEEVLQFYSTGVQQSATIDAKMSYAHAGGVQLSKEKQQQIIAFLKTLSDTAFIHDPSFKNPFQKR